MKKFNLIMAGIVSTSVIAPITAFAGDITVKRGDTLSELAVKHNTSVSQIKSMNGLKNNVIRIGQKLKVSASVVNSKTGVIANCTYLNVRTAPNTSSKIKTTVKAGTKVEILSEKGSWYQVKANGATGYVSSKYVKGSNAVVPVSNPVKAKGGTTYAVVRGDTLSEIAAKHKTTIAKIKADNGMRSNTVYIGQKLKINVGGSATVTKPVTNATVHTVVRGDTLSEVAAKYGMSVNTLKSLNSLRTNTIYLGQKLKVTGNPIKAESKKIFQRPTVTNRVTSVYGPRSIGYHYGIDYALPGNQKIMAAADGVVSKSYEHHLWGEVVFIKHVINGKSYETIYAHLRENSRAVKAGDRVKAGQFIGWMGSTGNSTGQHLHFEIHPGGYVSQAKTAVDPAPYIK